MPAALIIIAMAASAHAEFETVRWRDENPSPSPVAGFQVYLGQRSRSYDAVIDVELPAADASGVYSYEIEIPDEAVTYLAVTAYDVSGEESGYSNEKVVVAGADLDGDGVADLADNCLEVPNEDKAFKR